MSGGPRSERVIVFCVGAVQFVNILDFIMVMPLGPDFARALDIPLSHIGYIGGSYTAAASVAGLVGALFLDRFDRRNALGVAMAGLVVGTVAGAFATGLVTLMLARVVAGAFGGPATSIAYSMIADTIPQERRGKAMGAVMGALAVASVVGVPLGLELAHRGSWNLPFFAVGALGAALATYTYVVLPPMTGHLAHAQGTIGLRDLVALVRPDVALSLVMTFLSMVATFLLVPSMPAYVLENLKYPRERFGLLYLVGGSVSFVAMRVVGVLVDRYGSSRVASFGTLCVSVLVYAGFVRSPPAVPVFVLFVGWMFGMSFRNVAYNTLTSKVPRPEERARFSSVQSSVQHLASAVGAFASAELLTELPDKTLAGIGLVAMSSIVLSLALLPMFFVLEARVRARLVQNTSDLS